MSRQRSSTKNQEIIEVLEKKFELAKALAQFREGISQSQDRRKIDYATYLYGLKTKHSDKLFEQSMQRLQYLHNLPQRRVRKSKK